MGKDIDFDLIRRECPDIDLSKPPLEAVMKKVLGMPLTPDERETIREINRRNGWSK